MRPGPSSAAVFAEREPVAAHGQFVSERIAVEEVRGIDGEADAAVGIFDDERLVELPEAVVARDAAADAELLPDLGGAAPVREGLEPGNGDRLPVVRIAVAGLRGPVAGRADEQEQAVESGAPECGACPCGWSVIAAGPLHGAV